jgi:hypothetical protein
MRRISILEVAAQPGSEHRNPCFREPLSLQHVRMQLTHFSKRLLYGQMTVYLPMTPMLPIAAMDPVLRIIIFRLRQALGWEENGR